MIGNPIEIDEPTVELKHERLHATASRETPCPDAVHSEIAKPSNMPVVHPEEGDKSGPSS